MRASRRCCRRRNRNGRCRPGTATAAETAAGGSAADRAGAATRARGHWTPRAATTTSASAWSATCRTGPRPADARCPAGTPGRIAPCPRPRKACRRKARRPGTASRRPCTGLLTLLPIWLTWVVVKFVFVLLSDVSKPWVQPLSRRIAEGNPLLGWFADDWVQTTIAMIATLLVILLVGWLARRVIGQRLLGWFEALVARVPLASTIYGSARKLLDILQTKPDGTQREVLMHSAEEGGVG